MCSALPPSVRLLHGFRAQAVGCRPWLGRSLFPAGPHGSAPCPSSFLRPAPRHGGCQFAPAGPAVTAACVWMEAPDWPGSAARALRDLRFGQELLRLLSLRAPLLLLPLIQMPGRWMCPGGSPQLHLKKQWLLEQQTELVRVRALELMLPRPELGHSPEPMLALLLLLIPPAGPATALPARGAAERSVAAVVRRLAAETAIAAIGHGRWIWRVRAAGFGTVETLR